MDHQTELSVVQSVKYTVSHTTEGLDLSLNTLVVAACIELREALLDLHNSH